jgi:hypothetical protein
MGQKPGKARDSSLQDNGMAKSADHANTSDDQKLKTIPKSKKNAKLQKKPPVVRTFTYHLWFLYLHSLTLQETILDNGTGKLPDTTPDENVKNHEKNEKRSSKSRPKSLIVNTITCHLWFLYLHFLLTGMYSSRWQDRRDTITTKQ